jgi:hypothetical protein
LPVAERLDGVDLRIGIPDAAVASVIIAFELDTREPSERAIHLLENLPGMPTRLMAAGVAARLECSLSRCEVVVELRPARRARLGPDWARFYSGSGHRLRLAEEWVTTQRILVAALTASIDDWDAASIPARVPVRAESARGLLSARHLEFLATCAGLMILEDQLTLLGPIRERAWTLQQGDLHFRVRRWTAGLPASACPLDLVDLEAQTSAPDAPFLFPALRSLARQHHVDSEAEANPMAVRALISAWANSDAGLPVAGQLEFRRIRVLRVQDTAVPRSFLWVRSRFVASVAI